MRRRTLLAATAGAAALAALPIRPASAFGLVGTHVVLPSGRTYWLTPGSGSLVVGLHGTSQTADAANAAFWSGIGGWQGHALSRGYSLALAEAVAGKWNVGAGWPGGTQDDVQYLLDVAADAAGRAPVSEVFAAGFSSGGALAWRAAAEHPEVFAACALASGWAPVRPAGPIDCYHAHGGQDSTVPIRGGAGTGGYVFPPAADEGRLAARGSRVVLYPIPTMGHAVPGWMADAVLSFCTVDRLRP